MPLKASGQRPTGTSRNMAKNAATTNVTKNRVRMLNWWRDMLLPPPEFVYVGWIVLAQPHLDQAFSFVR